MKRNEDISDFAQIKKWYPGNYGTFKMLLMFGGENMIIAKFHMSKLYDVWY